MHSRNTTSAVEAMINQFPYHLQNQVRLNLAEVPLLVLSQRLLPNMAGDGLVLAGEKLINSFRIKNFIRENRVHQIRSQIQTEADDFASLDTSLQRLAREGKITRECALLYAENPEFVVVPNGAGERAVPLRDGSRPAPQKR
jgi:twitching motility protein PilT